MGNGQISNFRNRNRHSIIYLLFLLLSGSTLVNLVAAGRQFSKQPEAATQQKQEMDEKMAVRRQIIGSTPPRCERRCSNCDHCEAIQVPVTTRILTHKRSYRVSTEIAYFRGDGMSNYKPMSWKCKCGNLILNP